MKLLDIISTVGAGIVREAVPGGGLIIDVINELLPADKRLPSTATGHDVRNAVTSLPPDAQAAILEKEFDIDITQIKESNQTVRAMLEADAKNPHTTRPYIAKQAFHIVAFAVVVIVTIWAYGVTTNDSALVSAVVEGWQFVLAAIGPLVTLLWAYFGILKTEHKHRLDTAQGISTPTGLSGLVSALFKKGSAQ